MTFFFYFFKSEATQFKGRKGSLRELMALGAAAGADKN